MSLQRPRWVLSGVIVAAASAWSACRGEGVAVDAGVLVEDLTVGLSPEQEQGAVAAVSARVGSKGGACAQVRSIKDRTVAEAAAAAVTSATRLPAELIEKDLGPKGLWWRLCVGDEDSPARLVARATRWTAPGGLLESFLDPRVGNDPRFFVHEKVRQESRKPTQEQALALLRRSSTGEVFFAGTSQKPLLASTGAAAGSAGRVVVVDVDGRLLPFDDGPTAGCASCALAQQKSPVVSRRVVAVGDVLPAAGEELLVEEESGDGTRVVAVVVDDQGTLRRHGAILLASASAGLILRGEANVVEADGDDDREVAVTRVEMRTLGGNLCTLESHAEIWATAKAAPVAKTGVSQTGLAKLDALWLAAQPDGDNAVVDLVTALDGAVDPDAASRVCASVLAARPYTLVSQLCLQRVRTLIAEGRLIDGVNAAGALAEGTPALRAAIAAPLFAAMSALDEDVRLSAAPWDCQTEPLLKDLPSKSLEEAQRIAHTVKHERLSLADVKDAVFVTAARDFGPDTPVGQIAARWLARLQVAQPARHAAIEALLLPPASEASDGTPGFGGSP